MIKKIINLIINSPLYPHWLEWKKSREANNYILKSIHGRIIEVGAGDGTMKSELLKKHKNIKEYLATDYSSWDKEFEKINQTIIRSKILALFLSYRKRIKLDNICSAEKLPYKDNTFDYHLSFEVLEHIQNHDKYFEEATRVVKRGGKIIAACPFLFRMHGVEPNHKFDYFRYANGFFYGIAEKYNLKLNKIYNNTGFGTTFASLTNQWLIQRIKESNTLFKLFILVFSPFLFTFTNLIGLLIDLNPDKRFATRFYAVLEKK